MYEYILFVDTETTGFPTDWNKPYAADAQWPHIAQLAWVIFRKDGQYIKGENHFLQVPKGAMKASAQAIHGITAQFLAEKGEPPTGPLKRLLADLKIYQPLVVGHYVRLDYHMLGVDFYRAGLSNVLGKLQTFCTMQALLPQRTGGEIRYQRLGEVYERLFHTQMERQHEAWIDANATAKVFFELLRTQEITNETIERYPQLTIPKKPSFFARFSLPLAVFALCSILFVVISWLYDK